MDEKHKMAPQACPVLGLEARPDFALPTPSAEHRCHAHPQPEPITLGHQADYCLGGGYRQCPVWQLLAKPAVAKWPAAELPPRRAVPKELASTLYLLALVAVAAVAALTFALGGSPIDTSRSPSATLIAVPEATAQRNPAVERVADRTPREQTSRADDASASERRRVGRPPPSPAETRDRVALQIDTPVARTWRDSAGTVRVHVVVSATNDTSDVRSLAAAERTFRLISAAGRTVHTGRFAYAFPFVVRPGGTSHLITTVVLPIGVDATNVRVEAEILADITTAVQPMLEVSDLRLVSSEGRPGVRGIVRNTGAEDVTFGVVAVIGRDASGRVIGGFYDNVNVASIAAGGEATFQTEYPGLPSAAAGRIADLSGVAFDVGYQP